MNLYLLSSYTGDKQIGKRAQTHFIQSSFSTFNIFDSSPIYYVKKSLFLLLLMPLFCCAQTVFYNGGSDVYVQQNALIHVQGGFVNSTSDTSGSIQNDGTIEIKGDFENRNGAAFKVSNNASSKDRVVKFVGSGQQLIKGAMSTAGRSSFYNLVVDKASALDTVEMQTPVIVEGSLVFGTANTTSTYNPANTYTSNNQKGLFKTFNDSVGESLLDVQNGNPDAISGYPVLEISGAPSTGFILTKGTRGSSDGGLKRKISSATSYVFPVGTQDKGFNGVRLNFSQVPGNGSVKAKFCSGSSNPDGHVGKISQFCAGCSGSNPASKSGYNRYFTSNDCNGGAPQWLVFENTAKDHGYWSFESTNTGYYYDMEVFPNNFGVRDQSSMWRVIKHEASYGSDASLASVDWMPEIDSLVSNISDLLTYTKNAGCYSGSGVPGGIYRDFSEFTLGEGGSGEALPVTLMYVKADPVGKHHVKVSWATALEINNRGFTVMRSTDAINFTEVGWVEGHNNTTVTQNYSFDDRPSQSIEYYYKLKQIDNDGHYTYSYIVEAKLADHESSDFNVYPNPSTNNVLLEVSNPVDEVKVTIYDMGGQAVYSNIFTVEQNNVNQILTINAANLLPLGTYVLTANTNGMQYSSKFVLQ